VYFVFLRVDVDTTKLALILFCSFYVSSSCRLPQNVTVWRSC